MEISRDLIATLIRSIWDGVPRDYKSRYRLTIWDQFENEIKSAAYTSSLPVFVTRLCQRLGASLGRTPEERAVVESILKHGEDKTVLRIIREETAYLVLLVRIDNQEKRDEWKAKTAEESGEQLHI